MWLWILLYIQFSTLKIFKMWNYTIKLTWKKKPQKNGLPCTKPHLKPRMGHISRTKSAGRAVEKVVRVVCCLAAPEHEANRSISFIGHKNLSSDWPGNWVRYAPVCLSSSPGYDTHNERTNRNPGTTHHIKPINSRSQPKSGNRYNIINLRKLKGQKLQKPQ